MLSPCALNAKKLPALLHSKRRREPFRPHLPPIETLSMGRKDYDPYAEVTKMLTDLRSALAATP